MADSGSLRLSGLHFDDFNKIRVFEPDSEQKTAELQDECKEFVSKVGEFREICGDFLQLTDRLAVEVEKEKVKAIGCRNSLRNLVKEKEAKRQQIEALIHEKRNQLERLRLQYVSLVKVESEQNEFVEQFLLHK